jgi:hypothetical protein
MGIAAKYLARKHSKIVGFVGACAHSRTQLMFLIEVCKELEELECGVGALRREASQGKLLPPTSFGVRVISPDLFKLEWL